MKKHLITVILILILVPLILSGCNAQDGIDPPSSPTADNGSVPPPSGGSDTQGGSEGGADATGGGGSTPTPTPGSGEKNIKILAIGNSFSVDAMEYLWSIFKDAGYDSVELGNLYIGGCSLNTHWSNIQNETASYTYYQNVNGTWTTTANTSANSAIRSKNWDVVTIQQASGNSGVISTYAPLNDILDFIESNTPDTTKILWHMTWAYQGNSTHSAFPTYNSDQLTMYNDILRAVSSEILTNNRIDGVIPSGTTVQNLRTSYFGDTLTRDGYHMSYTYGRYATALTWFAYISGMSIENIDWTPSSYPEIIAHLSNVKESVNNAIRTPFAVTNSTHTSVVSVTDAQLFEAKGLNIQSYRVLSLDITTNRFYNSTLSHDMQPASDRNSPYYSATQILTEADLPDGSVIIVDAGYKYRPEGWENSTDVTLSSSRPANVSDTFVVVDDAWWGSFTLRAFNLSRTDGAEMRESDNLHIRIYVPVN